MSSAGRVLLVDSEDLPRAYLACVLENEGYEVLQASDGLEAHEWLDSCPPDVMLLDLSAAGAGQFMRACREDHRFGGQLVALVDEWAPVDDLLRAVSDPAATVLARPFAMKDAVALVEDCIGRRAIGVAA